ncbi:PBSX family phage terminase large subunit [Treponema sp.]|uniref:PBSX family phage terminase large subunit n=1 Tax=Treponema sp. TaxID=166 RepID=UPI00388F9C11
MIEVLSEKQKEILSFVVSDCKYLICDGAVRSGKTVVMSKAFIIWAMEYFDGCIFAICSKTVTNAERNVLNPLVTDNELPYRMKYHRAERYLSVTMGKKENKFYLFGGKDESSYMLIQGITLAGVLLDEVALMPRSFVEQAISRTLTYDNKKIWFNCNPEGQLHWFNQEWIIPADAGEKPVKHLHFLMSDNPIMSAEAIKETENMFSGVFYDRYIKGMWVAAEGLIYDMFDTNVHVIDASELEYEGGVYISADYGIQNANVWLMWRKQKGINRHVVLKECYYSGRDEHKQKTVSELVSMLDEMLGKTDGKEGIKPEKVIVDPSAAALIIELRKRGYSVQSADNDVLDGIADVSTMLKKNMIAIDRSCKNTINEFGVYCWDDKAAQRGIDQPVKSNDHAQDAIRYYVRTRKLVKKDWNGKEYNAGRYISRWH